MRGISLSVLQSDRNVLTRCIQTEELFDFDFFSQQHHPGTGIGGLSGIDDGVLRELLGMSEEQQRQLAPPAPPPFPPNLLELQGGGQQQQQQQQQPSNPLLTQTFLAWLQYMNLQNQLHQHTQVQLPFSFNASAAPLQPAHDTSSQPASSSGPSRGGAIHQFPSGGSQPPSPEPQDADDGDQQTVSEDKRRRNTAASGISKHLPRGIVC